METHRQVELFTFGPERVVIGIAPFSSIYVIGSEENSTKAIFLYGTADLLDGTTDIVRRNHGHAKHALGIGSGEVVEPIIVGARHGCGEIGIEIIDAQNGQAAGRKSVSYTHLTLPTSDLV